LKIPSGRGGDPSGFEVKALGEHDPRQRFAIQLPQMVEKIEDRQPGF
jgi:hypothetical protein